MPGALYIGLMSGTSVDAIDSALVHCGESFQLLATHEHPLPAKVKSQIAALSHSGPHEIESMGRLDRRLGQLFADAALALLDSSGHHPLDVTAIGNHGQTIRHRPPSGAQSAAEAFTLQIGDPNTIAERTGITTVADFRRRDVAAGGQGAPLAPAFHAAAFASEGINRAIINIGGIANVSLLQGSQLHSGFDSGPGNTLLDQWVARHLEQNYDRNGDWSAAGKADQGLLELLLAHPYFDLRGPRSTGREDFNMPWLESCLALASSRDPRNVQATLAEFTATSIVRAIRTADIEVDEVYVCGGGAHNADLMHRLGRLLGSVDLADTSTLGIGPDWVEAATFAWLAGRTLDGLHGNAPAVTGALAPRVLGGIYPG